MRLTITTNVSVDGVMQGLGGADAFLFGRRTYEIFARESRLGGRPEYATSTANPEREPSN
jgi:dihydrofolate reductase